jgi:hypothetical protein
MAAVMPTQNTSESERPDALRIKLLMKAIQRGDVAEVQVVLSGEADVNATTPYGTTPLMSAAACGHLEIVRALLKRGAALNHKRSDGFTALALAAFFGQQETVRELLACGADVRAISRRNTSPEMWATARGFLQIADLLKTAGEQPTGAIAPRAFPTSAPTISNSPAESSSVSTHEEDPDEITLVRPRPSPVADKVDSLSSPSCEAGEYIRKVEPLGGVTSASIEFERRVDPVVPFPVADKVDSLSSPSCEAGEYIRKVEPLGGVISAPIEFERRVDPVVPFSPFSALRDRLASSWLQSAVVLLVIAIVSAAVTFTILKAVKSRRQPGQAQVTAATSAPEPTERSPLSATQPVPVPTEQAKPPASSSPEGTPLEEVSSRPSDHVAAANAHPLPSYDSSPASIRSANRTEAKGRASISVSSYGNEGVRPARTKRRGTGVVAAPVSNGPAEVNTPAPLAVESKEQVPPARNTKASDIPSLPVEPIKGSTTKRKVIQWP